MRLEPQVRFFFQSYFNILLTIIIFNSTITPCQQHGQGEEVEDNDNKGVRDACVSRAPGMFFFLSFLLFY
jgi:hypothetical protein